MSYYILNLLNGASWRSSSSAANSHKQSSPWSKHIHSWQGLYPWERIPHRRFWQRAYPSWAGHIHSWEEHIHHKKSWQGHIHIHNWKEHNHHKRSWQGHIHSHSWEEHIHHQKFWQGHIHSWEDTSTGSHVRISWTIHVLIISISREKSDNTIGNLL